MGELANRFKHHPPEGDQADRHAVIRKAAHDFALVVIETTLRSRERSLALTKIEEACFWANSAISRNETPGEYDAP
jgi:hypothetical protein